MTKQKDPKALVGEVVKEKTRTAKNFFKRAGWMALAESVLLGILGIVLIIWPESAVMVAAWILGLFLIVLGVYKIIDYFAVRGMYDFHNNQLLTGLVALLIGIVVIVLQGEISGALRIIIGIWMIYAALVRMNAAIRMKAAKMNAWSYSLLMAALMMVVGIFVLFNSGAVMTLIGWAMLVVALLGIVDDIIYLYRVDTFADRIEGFFKDK